MLVRTRAIVLRTIKYGEASFVADLLTEEYGRMSFLLHIPKTGKGKVKKQFFQPLSVLELVIDYRERKNLQHIRDVRMAVQMPGIALHPDFLRSDEAARLHDLFRMNYETMHLFRMSRQDRNRVTELALRYYRLHVPDMLELKCLDVLKTLFD